MIDYHDILRLHYLGKSQRSIALEVQSSRDTVADTLKAADKAGVSWPLEDDVSNKELQEVLFPGRYALASPYTVPDYEWMHRELAKMGVTLTLLWSEYCVKVRDSGGKQSERVLKNGQYDNGEKSVVKRKTDTLGLL